MIDEILHHYVLMERAYIKDALQKGLATDKI